MNNILYVTKILLGCMLGIILGTTAVFILFILFAFWCNIPERVTKGRRKTWLR